MALNEPGKKKREQITSYIPTLHPSASILRAAIPGATLALLPPPGLAFRGKALFRPLRKIPGFGKLMGTETTQGEKRELLVIIRPLW